MSKDKLKEKWYGSMSNKRFEGKALKIISKEEKKPTQFLKDI